MKKLLLSLAALVGLSTFAHAEGTTLVMESFYGMTSTGSAPASKTAGDYTVAVDKATGGNAPAYNVNGKDLRLYANNTITISTTGADITSLKFVLSAQGKKQYAKVTASEGTVAAQTNEDTELSWTGSAKSVTFTVGAENTYGSDTKKTSGQFDFSQIDINGGGEQPVTPPTPPAETVKVANIAAFLANPSPEDTYEFTSPVNVVYQYNSGQNYNLYVQDATGSMLVYGNTKQTYQKGDVVPAGFKGKYKDYYGTIELENVADFAAASGTAEVTPKEYAVKDLTLEKGNEYVIVKGVKVAAGKDEKTFVVSQNGAEIGLYNKFGISVGVAESCDIIGVINCYQAKGETAPSPQLYPIEVVGQGGGDEPVTPPSGDGATIVIEKFYNMTSTGNAPASQTAGDYTVAVNKADGSNAPSYNATGKDLRLYAKNTMTISTKSGELTSLKFVLSAQGQKQYAAVTASVGAVAQQAEGDAELTWTGNAKEVTFTVGATNDYGSNKEKTSGQFDFLSIDINGGGDEPGVTPPTPTERVKVANIEAFLAVEPGTEVTFTSPVNVVYQNGLNLYVEDATGGMFIYGTTNQTYAKGDVIPAGFEGKYTDYNGCIEFEIPKGVDAKFAAASGTAEVNPVEWALEDVSTDIQNQYVVVKDVTLESVDGAIVATQNGAELTVYDKFGINLATGEHLNVTGLVAVYQNALQLYPLEVTDQNGSAVVAVAAPVFSVKAGTVDEGTKVEITCETEGAIIYYTVDGTEPTEASTKYTEAIVIDKDMTIKAIAVKEGLSNSVVVEAEYTLIAKPAGIAVVFDFEDPSTLTPSYSKDVPADVAGVANFPGMADDTFNDKTNGYFYVVTDTEFKSGNVTLTTNKGTTDARLYYSLSASKWGYRAYKKSTMTISVPAGFAITGLHFEGNNVTNEVCDKVTYEGTKANATWTGNASDKISTLEFSNADGTATFNKMTVYVVDLAGVEGVEADEADAAVEYFNLQGVRVANPENGLYIRRQGNKVEKVVIR